MLIQRDRVRSAALFIDTPLAPALSNLQNGAGRAAFRLEATVRFRDKIAPGH
jgi:hypothetical protein